VLRTTKITIANLAVALAAGGCVDGFKGSNIQIDLRNKTATSTEFPVQAGFGQAVAPGVLAQNTHFTLYGLPDTSMQGNLVELTRFEVHRLVDLSSPCFIDVADEASDRVPYPGIHVTKYGEKVGEANGFVAPYTLANPPPDATDRQKIEAATAEQRMENIVKLSIDIPDAAGKVGVRAVTTASAMLYPQVAADCNGPADEIPPPTCDDEASNQRRLSLCQASWASDPNLWEGTDRVLTQPLAGITRGMADGVNPVNAAPVDGASFFIDDPLTLYKGFAINSQTDNVEGPGTRIVTSVAINVVTRGVTRVTLAGAAPGGGAPIVVLMSMFTDLSNDSVHF